MILLWKIHSDDDDDDDDDGMVVLWMLLLLLIPSQQLWQLLPLPLRRVHPKLLERLCSFLLLLLFLFPSSSSNLKYTRVCVDDFLLLLTLQLDNE